MNRRLSCLLVGSALVLPAAGCGTYNNVLGDNHHMVYGGVRRDGVILRECGGSSDRDGERADERVMPFVNNMAAMTAFMDMPFSFVGDTITLPYTLCCAIAQSGDEDEEPRPAARGSTTASRR